MEHQEYMRLRNRMIKARENIFYCSIDCKTCPLYSKNNGLNISCSLLERAHPERAEELVEKWGNEHPVKTRLDKLLEIFPKAEIVGSSVGMCPKFVNKEYNCPDDSCQECRDRYWLGEYEEQKKEE